MAIAGRSMPRVQLLEYLCLASGFPRTGTYCNRPWLLNHQRSFAARHLIGLGASLYQIKPVGMASYCWKCTTAGQGSNTYPKSFPNSGFTAILLQAVEARPQSINIFGKDFLSVN